ncbi:hypothetical protein N2152v2_008308 [Parachlorella kessleri]
MSGKDQWAAKSLRSGFGHQCTSTKPSSPGFGFGSSSRDAFQAQYSSAEVDKAKVRSQGGNNPLGAAYNVPSSIEKQVTSDVVSPPKVSFGTSKRAPLASPTAAPGPGAYKLKAAIANLHISPEHDKTMVGKSSPGPGNYTVPGGLGLQQLSTKKTLPSFKLGTGPRFVSPEMREAAGKPAPGSYNIPSTVGKLSDADGAGTTVRTSPAVRFGTSTRDIEAKVFISLEHEKGLYGTQSPGPVTAQPGSGLGKQQLSTKHSSPTVGFGTGKRLVENDAMYPGPGAYYA